jgi:hypothetical protein
MSCQSQGSAVIQSANLAPKTPKQGSWDSGKLVFGAEASAPLQWLAGLEPHYPRAVVGARRKGPGDWEWPLQSFKTQDIANLVVQQSCPYLRRRPSDLHPSLEPRAQPFGCEIPVGMLRFSDN